MNYEAIPQELKQLPQWVVHRAKRPYNPCGGDGKAGQPDTWGTFEEAVQAVRGGRYDGIGFEFHDNGLVGIDLDTVRDPESGWIAPDALEIIHSLASYTELSPSGYGFHIIAKADVALQWNKKKLEANGIQRVDVDLKTGEVRCDKDGNPKMKTPEIEMYTGGRYFTMTGNVYDGHTTISERTEAVNQLHNRWISPPAEMDWAAEINEPQSRPPVAAPVYMPDTSGGKDYLADALRRGKDTKLMALWKGERPNRNESADDQGLMNKLAYWCNCDADRMIDAFLQSPHFALKDDAHKKKCDRVDYLRRTAQKAIADCRQTAENADWNFRNSRRQQAAQEFAVLIGDGLSTLDQLKPDTNPRYRTGDIGNGALFADVFKNRALFGFENKRWYVYDGKRWIKDPNSLAVMELCKQLADALMHYATSLPEDEHSKQYIAEVTKWRSRSKRETILKDATSVYPVMMDEFDSNPYLFNCKNGTLDLKTGEFHSHTPHDMITMLAGVSYNPAAFCPRWEQFISEVMQDDAEKALFLQKALGYALTGDTALECFFVLYGATTRNGKGTTMETFKHLMGDYGAAASPQTIAQKKNPDSRAPSEDIARLAGKRFVNLSEPDQAMVLSSATVKTMTGNDTINARFLHEGSFEFVPQFKLFINTNHLPRVTDPTVFSSGRVKVIPFERHFEPAEQDKTLKQTLMQPENLSGVLNWCIEGLRRMQAEGLEAPASVLAATGDYQQSNDKMALFFADRMRADPQGETAMEILYAAYADWCKRNGFMATNRKNFNADVERYCGDSGTIKKKRPKGCTRDSSPVSTLVGYDLMGMIVYPQC
ncbi:phage/plasmid primase, P4 family [Butyricicoccus sp.]|uniref:phage/plasmid primase, P4 family n=1 Tax=Butyricicoccus sp. TaxID=2049021 RepID=UPI003F1652A7